MEKLYAVLLHAGYIFFSFIFASSAVVTFITWLKMTQKKEANKVWLSGKWLMMLFLCFGSPCAFLGFTLWNRGQTMAVWVTGVLALAFGILLGYRAEERLRENRL